MFEIVCTRYKENLDWLNNIPQGVTRTVYNKGDPLTSTNGFERVINLPNKGRESQAFLHHIVTQYDNLAPVTIFTQGKITDHIPNVCKAMDGMEYIVHLGHQAREHGISQNTVCEPDVPWAPRRSFKILTWNGETNEDSGTSFGTWFENYLLQEFPDQKEYLWYPGALFAVTKELIRRRPLSFYQRIIATVSNSGAPEASHFMERSWYYMFHPKCVIGDIISMRVVSSRSSQGSQEEFVVIPTNNAGSDFIYDPRRRTIRVDSEGGYVAVARRGFTALLTICVPKVGLYIVDGRSKKQSFIATEVAMSIKSDDAILKAHIAQDPEKTERVALIL